jgi:hypothetical protein
LLGRVSDNVDNVSDFVLLELQTLAHFACICWGGGGGWAYVGGESDHAFFAKATGEELACSRPEKSVYGFKRRTGDWLPLTEGVWHGAGCLLAIAVLART